MPSGTDSNFRVRLSGRGPGLNVDFVVLSFQASTQLSPARAREPEISVTPAYRQGTRK